MKTLTLLLGLAAFAANAQAPAGIRFWKAGELQSVSKQLAAKTRPGKLAISIEQLGNSGTHHFMLAHRQGDGEAELHDHENDLFVIQNGEGTVVLGGSMVNRRSTEPGEHRATSIQGGEKKAVSAGDVVFIPAGTPHQMLVTKQVSYFVVKTRK